MKIHRMFEAVLVPLVIGTMAPAAAQSVYGNQLMTEQERAEHRATLRNLQTEQERERYRLEHHKKMQARAKEMGLSLPDQPAAGRKGMGMNQGRGGAGRGQ